MKSQASTASERLKRMFELGPTEVEGERCLKECRTKLITAGEKAGNLPKDYAVKVRFMASLRSKGMNVARDWFTKNCAFADLPNPMDSLAALRADKHPSSMELEVEKKHWRSLFAEFARQKCPMEISEFLSTASVSQQGGAQKTNSSAESAMMPSRAQPLVKLVEVTAATEQKVGIEYSATLAYGSDELDATQEITILGCVTRQLLNKQIFIHVLGIFKSETLLRISLDQGKKLFNGTGDVAAFYNSNPSLNASVNETCIWRVRLGTGSKYVAYELVAKMHEVHSLPHLSSEPNKVREWLKSKYDPGKSMHPIFRLKDEIVLKMFSDLHDFRHAHFDQPLQAYRRLSGIAIGSQVYVQAPLPVADYQYYCPPIELAVKKVLRFRTEVEGLRELSNTQIRELAAVIDNSSDDLAKQALKMVRDDIARITEDKTLLKVVIDDLLGHPVVAADIEAEKKRLIKEFEDLLSKSKGEILKLATEKKRLQDDIERLRLSGEKQAKETIEDVKKAFLNASELGTKKLADIAIFKALAPALFGMNPDATASAKSTIRQTSFPSIKTAFPTPAFVTEASGLRQALKKVALCRGLSSVGLVAMASGAIATGLLAVTGAQRRLAIDSLAEGVFSCGSCYVSVSGDMFGIKDLLNAPAVIKGQPIMPLGDFLLGCQHNKIPALIELRGFNRVPVETYLPELVEMTRTSSDARSIGWNNSQGVLCELQLQTPLVFVLEFLRGATCVQGDVSLASSICIADTDIDWGDADPGDPGIKCAPVSIAPVLWATLAQEPPGFVPGQAEKTLSALATQAQTMLWVATVLLQKPQESQAAVVLGLGTVRVDKTTMDSMLQNIGNPLGSKLLQQLDGEYFRKFDHMFKE